MATFWGNSLNFANLTVKSAPIGADSILIADSTTSPAGQPKQTLISDLPFAPASGANVVNVTASTQAMAINTVYFVNYTGGACTLTLPTAASSVQGSEIEIVGSQANTAGFIIAQAASQFIAFGNQNTTAGTGGSLTSGTAFDSIRLRASNATGGLCWSVVEAVGNFSGA